MPKWTTRQDEIVMQYAREGAEGVMARLEEAGYRHTKRAVQMRASRLGISLVPYEICTACGGRFREVGSDGLCAACHMEELLGRERAKVAVVADSKATPEYRERKREYDRLRQRRLRAQKRL